MSVACQNTFFGSSKALSLLDPELVNVHLIDDPNARTSYGKPMCTTNYTTGTAILMSYITGEHSIFIPCDTAREDFFIVLTSIKHCFSVHEYSSASCNECLSESPFGWCNLSKHCRSIFLYICCAYPSLICYEPNLFLIRNFV